MRRAEIIKEKRIIRKHFLSSALSSCTCAFLLIAVCCYLPRLSVIHETPNVQNYGSLLLAVPYMGHVTVGLLAFALGVSMTLLCVRWKALKQKERERK
ncbi:MAG: hypothetical protein K5855_04980 [Oscillospiraceae bacterium]|nr:hypothetical protein [Oscillospiraceae bacterium]